MISGSGFVLYVHGYLVASASGFVVSLWFGLISGCTMACFVCVGWLFVWFAFDCGFLLVFSCRFDFGSCWFVGLWEVLLWVV